MDFSQQKMEQQNQLVVFGFINLPQKYEVERDVVMNFIALMSLTSIIANGILLLVIIKDPFKQLRNITAIILAFTSASNLSISLVLFLDDVFYWSHEKLCPELILYSGLFTSCLYIVGNALHTVNIYGATVTPVRYAIYAPKVRKLLVKSLFLTWVITLAIVIIPPFTLQKDKVPSFVDVMMKLVFILLTSFVLMFGCLYTKVLHALYARKRRRSLSFHLKRSTVLGQTMNKKEQNIVKTLFIHVSFFMITTFPGCIVFLVLNHCTTCDHVAVQLAALFAVPITYIPIMSLPFLWLLRLENYRRAMIKTLIFWKRQTQSSNMQGNFIINVERRSISGGCTKEHDIASVAV